MKFGVSVIKAEHFK